MPELTRTTLELETSLIYRHCFTNWNFSDFPNFRTWDLACLRHLVHVSLTGP